MDVQGKKKKHTHCTRCGTCCEKGGPALHQEDIHLFKKGVLDRCHVYTIRAGEPVRDLDETLMVLQGEIIKIKGKGREWKCLFFDNKENTCLIYDHRPIECRALKCWDIRDLKDVMNRPYLQRRDLLNANDGILKIMDAHEKKCSYQNLESATKALDGPDSDDASEKIIDIIKYDEFTRPFLVEKLSLDPEMMDFFFGRPLSMTIGMFGLRVKQEGDTFFLEPIKF